METLRRIFGRRVVEVKVSQIVPINSDERYILFINGPLGKPEFKQLVDKLKEQGVENVHIQTIPYAFRIFQNKNRKKGTII